MLKHNLFFPQCSNMTITIESHVTRWWSDVIYGNIFWCYRVYRWAQSLVELMNCAQYTHTAHTHTYCTYHDSIYSIVQRQCRSVEQWWHGVLCNCSCLVTGQHKSTLSFPHIQYWWPHALWHIARYITVFTWPPSYSVWRHCYVNEWITVIGSVEQSMWL